MKKTILILVLTLTSVSLKAQVIKEDECYEDYKPCTECFEGVDKWQSTNNTNVASNTINNASQNVKSSNNTVASPFLKKTGEILSRPVRVAAAVVGSVLMAIFVVKLTNMTNAITQ